MVKTIGFILIGLLAQVSAQAHSHTSVRENVLMIQKTGENFIVYECDPRGIHCVFVSQWNLEAVRALKSIIADLLSEKIQGQVILGRKTFREEWPPWKLSAITFPLTYLSIVG